MKIRFLNMGNDHWAAQINIDHLTVHTVFKASKKVMVETISWEPWNRSIKHF